MHARAVAVQLVPDGLVAPAHDVVYVATSIFFFMLQLLVLFRTADIGYDAVNKLMRVSAGAGYWRLVRSLSPPCPLTRFLCACSRSLVLCAD